MSRDIFNCHSYWGVWFLLSVKHPTESTGKPHPPPQQRLNLPQMSTVPKLGNLGPEGWTAKMVAGEWNSPTALTPRVCTIWRRDSLLWGDWRATQDAQELLCGNLKSGMFPEDV